MKLSSVFQSAHNRVQYLQATSHLLLPIAFIHLTGWQFFLGILWGLVVFNIGHGLGAHRYFSHQQFETTDVGEVILNFFFSLTLWGSSVGYASVHMLHHKHSDGVDDPHCVHNSSFFRAWFLNDFGHTKFALSVPTYKRLIRNPINAFFHKYYFLVLLLWSLFLLGFGFEVFLIFFVLPACMSYHLGKVQVVLSHMPSFLGGAPCGTGDQSRNLYWLKPLLWGDELHNNHHYRPRALNLNFRGQLSEFDPLYYIARAFFMRRTPVEAKA